MRLARHVASYAVSGSGGYGDVLIKVKLEEPTHLSFVEWLTG